jgi:hypothetical protein
VTSPDQLSLFEDEDLSTPLPEPPVVQTITVTINVGGVLTLLNEHLTSDSTQYRLDVLNRLYDQARTQILSQDPTG